MLNEELPEIPPVTAETQTAAQPAESASASLQAPTVERAGLIQRILNRLRNPMGKPKPTEMPTASDSQTETSPPPLTAREASFPPPAPPKAA